MHLGQFLSNVLGTAAHNIAGNTDNAVHAGANLLNGLFHTTQAPAPAAQARQSQPTAGYPAQAPLRPNVLNTYGPSDTRLPTQLNNVIGQVAMQGARAAFGFTPRMEHALSKSNIAVVPASLAPMPGVAGEYNPNDLSITQYGLKQKAYTLGHEALHAADFQQSPAEQQHFAQIAQAGIDPRVRGVLAHKLGGDVYGNRAGMGDITALPRHIQTEVNSYLPYYQDHLTPQLNAYYHQFLGDPNMVRPERAQNRVRRLGPAALHFATPAPYQPPLNERNY